MDDVEGDECACAHCGWQGAMSEVDQEYDGGGVVWWCPSCDSAWTESDDGMPF